MAVFRTAVTTRSDALARYESAAASCKAHASLPSFQRLATEAWASYKAAMASFDAAYKAYTDAHDAIRIGAADEAEACSIHEAAQASDAETRKAEALRFLEGLCSEA
jgi:hypothetical protein